MIICIDGLDGAGKTTQAMLLQNVWREQGRQATYCHFPVYDSPTGALLREYLRGGPATPETAALLFVANRQEAAARWDPAASPDSPDLVILDRYVPSGLVYGMEDGMDREWLLAINRLLPVPALTFILDASVETIQERLWRRTSGDAVALERYEQDPVTAERIRSRFLEEARVQGWHVLDAAQDQEALHEEIMQRVLRHMEDRADLDLARARLKAFIGSGQAVLSIEEVMQNLGVTQAEVDAAEDL